MAERLDAVACGPFSAVTPWTTSWTSEFMKDALASHARRHENLASVSTYN